MNMTGENTEKLPVSGNTVTFEYRPKPVFDLVKRLFDLTASSVCIIILAIPFAVISAMIMIDDHQTGPPVHSETCRKKRKFL